MNKYLENLKECIVIIHHQPCFIGRQKEQIIGTIIKACEKAEKYDEKETPKKVIKLPYKDIYGSVWGDSTTHYCNGCPVCKNNVGIDANYCRHCGQKLDWSDKDE